MGRFSPALQVLLCVVALALVVQLYLDHIRPQLWLNLHETDYHEAARRCHEATRERTVWAQIEQDLTPRRRDLFYRTSGVALMDCYERASLGLTLRSKGVGQADLERIDLMARHSAGVLSDLFVRAPAP